MKNLGDIEGLEKELEGIRPKKLANDVRYEVEKERLANEFFEMNDLTKKYDSKIRKLTVFTCCMGILSFFTLFMNWGLAFDGYQSNSVIRGIAIVFYAALSGMLLGLFINAYTIIKKEIVVAKYKKKNRNRRR